MGFSERDKVEARYRGGSTWYPGKISAINDDGTYSIKYDDGHQEKKVDSQYITIARIDGGGGGGDGEGAAAEPKHGLDLSEWRVGKELKGVPVGEASGEVMSGWEVGRSVHRNSESEISVTLGLPIFGERTVNLVREDTHSTF